MGRNLFIFRLRKVAEGKAFYSVNVMYCSGSFAKKKFVNKTYMLRRLLLWGRGGGCQELQTVPNIEGYTTI